MGTSPERWMGIDGEGHGRSPHRYVMLCAATADFHSPDVDYVEDVNGLSTVACLSWLLRLPANARTCGYFLGYDWTKILVDIPNRDLYRLLRPELRALPASEGRGFSFVHFRGFRLHYLAGSMTVERGKRRRVVWDVSKYYQCSFVQAVEAAGVPGARAMVERMKAERGGETWGRDLDAMRAYCVEECRMLADLATRLEASHHAVGIRPPAWYGPGTSAAAVMRKRGVLDCRGDDLPPKVRDAAERAFFGGRFEHATLGRVEGVTGYDIVSAYPAQTERLPCLAHGRWRWRSVKAPPGDDVRTAVVRYHVPPGTFRGTWGALPCRLRSGSIVFGSGGWTGWTWLDEWREAQHWGNPRYLGAWEWMQRCDCAPFAYIRELFDARHNGSPEEKRIYKYVLNSTFGKLAQRVGNPRFASVAWAGMITSGTRAELLRMMRRLGPESVVGVATDGLFSTTDVECPERPDLGEWERKPHGAMWFVRPGIYWAEDDETVRARGLGRRQLAAQVEAVKAAIAAGDEWAQCGETTLFGGARECVRRSPSGVVKRSPLYGEWFKVPARVGLSPAPKRGPSWELLELGGVDSEPYSHESESHHAMSAIAALLAARK